MTSMIHCNRLIAYLEPNERDALLERCDSVTLKAEEMLIIPSGLIESVYFPTGALMKLMMHQKDEKPLSIGLVGEEGLLGMESLLGVNVSPYYVQVHTDGTALRIPSDELNQLTKMHPLLKVVLDDYIAVLTTQFAQAAVCNGLHHLQQRLARLLLTMRDRLHSSKFSVTQDILATLLGVRRVGITRAASALFQRKILFYSRGRMEIINPQALELIACNCYGIDKHTYESIMPKHEVD